MTSIENKMNHFIDMVFLEPNQILYANEANIEFRVSHAIIQFAKKVHISQLGISVIVEEAFSRYFSCVELNAKRVKSIAMRHCLCAYDNFPVFFALMYNCAFLKTMADCCVYYGPPNFTETVPSLTKELFAYMTGSSYSPEDWEKLLEFSVSFNYLELIDLLKSCVTNRNNLFQIHKIDRNYAIFGICDVSALVKFQENHFKYFGYCFLGIFQDQFKTRADMDTIGKALTEFEFTLVTEITRIRLGINSIQETMYERKPPMGGQKECIILNFEENIHTINT